MSTLKCERQEKYPAHAWGLCVQHFANISPATDVRIVKSIFYTILTLVAGEIFAKASI